MPKNFAFFQKPLDKFFYKFDNSEINRQEIFPATFKYSQFSTKILCLQASVLIIHWHCFQVLNEKRNGVIMLPWRLRLT